MQYKSIKFEIDDFYIGYNKVVFQFKDYGVLVGLEGDNGLEWRLLNDEDAQTFIDGFDKLDFQNWEDKYVDPCTYFDDEEDWSLSVEYLDGKTKYVFGCDDYPKKWNELLVLMGRFIPIIEDKRIERLVIKFYDKHLNIINCNNERRQELIEVEEIIDIDRGGGKLVISREVLNGGEKESFEKTEIEKNAEISQLLDDINFIADKLDNTQQIAKSSDDIFRYELETWYYNHPKLYMQGGYNRFELPKNWSMIIDAIDEFMSFVSNYQILNINYNNVLLENEVIYVSVVFNDFSDNTYYYQTDNPNIKIGDMVIVPVGNANDESRAMVVDVEIYDKNEVPYSLNKTKKVIKIM